MARPVSGDMPIGFAGSATAGRLSGAGTGVGFLRVGLGLGVGDGEGDADSVGSAEGAAEAEPGSVDGVALGDDANGSADGVGAVVAMEGSA
jgi:hypothetical protein